MDRVLEFASNHPLLAGGFVVVIILIIFAEIARRFQGYSEVSTAHAVQLINRHDARVVDVSAIADFNKGHIADARNIPVSKLEAAINELGKHADKPILVVCKNGQAAPAAAARLVKNGLKQVSVIKGGMVQWTADNYPVTRN